MEITSEEKIIAAARKVFLEKGYAATRTRDIANEAGINLALLNYYFRSKEKLFQLIMTEKVQQLFSIILPIVNNDEMTLEQKLENLIENYINLFILNPDLPLFVISEIRFNAEGFKSRLHLQDILENSSIQRQIRDLRPDVNPIHFMTSILGMIVFPFISRPILLPDNTNFASLMEERKALIHNWTTAILKS